MKGWLQDAGGNRNAIDKGGWIHTGDPGVDEELFQNYWLR